MALKLDKSARAFAEAKRYIPGGVNSPVRACLSVDSTPLFIDSAHGSSITDVEGRSYIDYVLSWGPMLLGHAHPAVLEAAVAAARKGSSFGAPCPAEIELARLVVDMVPTIEMVRMVSSGTEATMSALRLARAFTGRPKVVKFTGCYHGHCDPFLAAAGSGAGAGDDGSGGRRACRPRRSSSPWAMSGPGLGGCRAAAIEAGSVGCQRLRQPE